MADLVDGFLAELSQLPWWAVLVAVCVVMAAETTMLLGVVVPGDLVVLFAASSAGTPVELALLVVAVTLGSLLGETVGFGVGRRWGPQLRSSRLGQRLGEERWNRAGDYLEQRGGRAVFLARYLAAIHALTPIVAGTVGMRYRRFICWCAAGGLSWSALYVALGAVAGASYRHYAAGIGTATSVAVGGLVGAGVFVAAVAVHHRGTLRNRCRFPLPLATWDMVLIGVTAAVVVLATGAADEPGSREPDAAAYAIAIAGVLALLGRRRWPLPVLGATVAAFGSYHLLDYPAGPPILAVLVALYATAAAGHLTWALAAGGLVTGSGIAYRLLEEGDNVLGTETTLGAAVLVAVALLGDRGGSASDDRHHPPDRVLALISAQADLATESLDRHPAAAREALRAIREISQRPWPDQQPGTATRLAAAEAP